MQWMCYTLLCVSSVGIAYQDFKSRLIGLWLVVIFALLNISGYLFSGSYYQLLENTAFLTCYLLFSYFVLQLYYFLKTRKFQRIIDTQIGWGDILLLFFTGICLEPVVMVYFFTASFVISIFLSPFFSKNNKQIPLAGILVLCYSIYLAALFVF